MSDRASIVIVDDHALFRSGVRSEVEGLVDVAGEAGSVEEEARVFVSTVIPAQNELREVADELETLVADDLWPLPKYRELLFQY